MIRAILALLPLFAPLALLAPGGMLHIPSE